MSALLSLWSSFFNVLQPLPHLFIVLCFFQKMDSDSDSEPPKKSRRSFTLRVAMKFPTKNSSLKKSPSPEPAPKSKDTVFNSDEEDFIAKRALNIKENKAMVRKYYATEFWLSVIFKSFVVFW